jgi:hypothetical protein
VLGGCITNAIPSILGAWVQKWPYFLVTGAIHGTLLALVGLIGVLTASMLNRVAELKDFGDLNPEHGGILDRVDSLCGQHRTAGYGSLRLNQSQDRCRTLHIIAMTVHFVLSFRAVPHFLFHSAFLDEPVVYRPRTIVGTTSLI